jgi:hypothetical protein
VADPGERAASVDVKLDPELAAHGTKDLD